jgi:hypothetical protein
MVTQKSPHVVQKRMAPVVEKTPELPQKLTTKVVQKETTVATQKAPDIKQVLAKKALEKRTCLLPLLPLICLLGVMICLS